MKRWVVGGSIALVACVGAFAWWHRGGASAPAGEGSGRSGELPGTPVERAPMGGGPGEPAVLLADDDPKGTLRLEGQVIDGSDHPVGGATVVLGASPPRTVTTEADGSFAFDGLVGRPYTVVARAAQGVAGPVTARLTDKTEPLVLRLRAGATLTVEAVGVDAKLIDGATVELRGVDRQTATTVKGVAKLAPVVPGMYEVVAYAPGMAHSYASARVAGDTRVRIMLAPGAAVSGRVVDDRGTAVAGARVIFAVAGEFRAHADPRLDGVTTGADGAFRFAALPAGSFRFIANHGDHAPGTSPLVALDGRTEKSGISITLAAGAVVRGKVVDTAKRPVSGARVRIGEPAGNFQRGRRGGDRQPPHQAYTDAQGAFEIRGLPRGELEATASHEIGASNGVPVDTTKGDAEVVLALDLTLTIAGVVVDPGGQPIEGAQVSAVLRGGDGPRGFGGNRETTDGSGRFKLTGLAAGTYFVRASRSALPIGGGRGRARDGVEAEAGKQDLKIVLPAEGGVKGKVAFADGTPPTVFTASVGTVEGSFAGGELALDAIAPGDYQLRVRGPMFDTRVVDVTVESGKTTDVGTVTVATGRQLAGVVMASGQPVAGATVYAGVQVRGSGTSNAAAGNGFGGIEPKQDTTAPDGTFALAGFGDGDLTIVAELPSIGRSKAMRVPEDAPNQRQLVLELEAYGALSGVLHQDASAQGVAVTAQSTTTPGAVYVVSAGADGAYRFDRLAPDTYKVSATLGSPRRGLRFYSKQVDVPAGTEVTVDLAVDAGAVTLSVTPVGSKGQVGIAIGWLASGAIAASTANELSLKLAAAGPGTSQMAIARPPEPATFTEVAPGAYSVCVVPLPLEVRGMQAIGYVNRHSGKLPAFCKQVAVGPAPATQPFDVPVVVPAMIPDDPPPGGGR